MKLWHAEHSSRMQIFWDLEENIPSKSQREEAVRGRADPGTGETFGLGEWWITSHSPIRRL